MSYETGKEEQNALLERDILSIFNLPEVKELGKKKTTEEEQELMDSEPSLAGITY